MIIAGIEPLTEAELVSQTIIDALALLFRAGQKRIQISVNIGIAFYSEVASAPNALLEAADNSKPVHRWPKLIYA